MIDYRLQQQTEVRQKGLIILDEDISHEQFIEGCKRNRWPAGSIWKWALQAVYGRKQ